MAKNQDLRVAHIEHQIQSRGLRPGDLIGTKTEIRESVGVAKATMNEAVRLLDGGEDLLVTCPGDRDDHRPEDFLLGETPRVVGAGQHGGPHVEVTEGAVLAGHAVDRDLDPGAGRAVGDVVRDPAELPGVDEGAHIGCLVKRISDAQAPQPLDDAVENVS